MRLQNKNYMLVVRMLVRTVWWNNLWKGSSSRMLEESMQSHLSGTVVPDRLARTDVIAGPRACPIISKRMRLQNKSFVLVVRVLVRTVWWNNLWKGSSSLRPKAGGEYAIPSVRYGRAWQACSDRCDRRAQGLKIKSHTRCLNQVTTFCLCSRCLCYFSCSVYGKIECNGNHQYLFQDGFLAVC